VSLKARERSDPASILVAVQIALIQHEIGPRSTSVPDQEGSTRSVADETSGMPDDELAKKARELIQGTLAAAVAPRNSTDCVAEITARRAEARNFVSHWLTQDARIVALVVNLAAKPLSSSSDRDGWNKSN
jgi:hypothetical protein